MSALMDGVLVMSAAEKHALLIDTLRAHGLRVFVESGTYSGDTVAAMLPHVDRVISVELSDVWWLRALKRFADDIHMGKVMIVHDDSGAFFPKLFPRKPNVPALWWLDAHLSGADSVGSHAANPLRAELGAIFANAHPEDVVLIDDARFLGRESWPTMEEIMDIVGTSTCPTGGLGWRVELKDDVVRIAVRAA